MSSQLCFSSARALAADLRAGRMSAVELLDAHLAQVERANPRVNAIVSLVADRARDAAREADRRLARGEPVGPLHGLPVAHKDTHATKGIRTTYGSPTMRDHVPTYDDLIVERMQAAGAVTFGKTNVPQFAAGAHTFNELFGATRNPYDLALTAGGSSGGAAAALACGMHPVADGSDMGGSLRFPAAFCNVVGLRPSPGRVPTHPSVAPWATLGVPGPMARSVADVAYLLGVIAGPDPRAPVSLDEPGSTFHAPLDRNLRGFRVAWTPNLGGVFPAERAVLDVLEPAVGVLADLGADVSDAAPDVRGADEVFRTLRAWQFELQYGAVRDRSPDQLKASLLRNIDEGRALRGSDVGRAEVLRGRLWHRMREFFERYDVLALPVSQLLPFPVETEWPTEVAGVEQADYLGWMRSCTLISATGHPALSVPGGFTAGGVPVGLQLVGRWRGDFELLQVGHAFEQATRFADRRPPTAL